MKYGFAVHLTLHTDDVTNEKRRFEGVVGRTEKYIAKKVEENYGEMFIISEVLIELSHYFHPIPIIAKYRGIIAKLFLYIISDDPNNCEI